MVSLLAASAIASAQSDTPESCLKQLTDEVDALLQKDQQPLFAWHLKSLKALAETEYAKLSLKVPRTGRREEPDRTKEFVDYVGTIAKGLVRDHSDPDDCLKNGRGTLILARPSDTDGSLQYMMVDLPKNWDPNRAYPLFVGLHGSGPDNPLAYPSFAFGPVTPPDPNAKPKPDAEMIHLTPWGRGNRSWRGDAERDLWEAINLLKTFCKLDPDRWYITGHSSGADGCWAIIQHTPDLWAAAGPQSGSMLEGRPEWGLIPNMQYLPVYFLVGEKDPLPPRVSDNKEAYDILTKLGDDTKLSILPGVGHYPLTQEGLDAQTAWLVGHTRKRPDRFTFTIDQPIHPGVWGITAVFPRQTRLLKAPWPNVECKIDGQNVRIKTTGIHELRIRLGDDGLKLTGNVKVSVNGKTVHDGPVVPDPIEVRDLE